MSSFIDFVNLNSHSVTIRNKPLIYIQSLLIPPRSQFREQLISDGWQYKKSLSKLSPIRCFVISDIEYFARYTLSPDEIEDLILINNYFN